jgi:hypothetical protein
MSTKIYNGYKIEAVSLEEAINKLSSLKKETVRRVIKECLVVVATTYYDQFTIENANFKKDSNAEEEKNEDKAYKVKPERSALSNAYSRNMDILLNVKTKIEDTYEEVSLCVFPEPIIIEGNKNYLLTLYANRPLENWLVEKWESLGVQEYAYWNNSDIPEELTDEQWDERGQHWDLVLTGKNKTGTPAVDGLTMFLAKEHKMIYSREDGIDDILQEIISEQPRMHNNATRVDSYMDNYKRKAIYKRLVKENPDKDPLKLASDVGAILFNKKVTQDEINNFIEKEKEFVKVLKNEITLEDLKIPLNQISQNIATKPKKI